MDEPFSSQESPSKTENYKPGLDQSTCTRYLVRSVYHYESFFSLSLTPLCGCFIVQRVPNTPARNVKVKRFVNSPNELTRTTCDSSSQYRKHILLGGKIRNIRFDGVCHSDETSSNQIHPCIISYADRVSVFRVSICQNSTTKPHSLQPPEE